jgi:antitoxin ParD1/3/4
MQITITPAFDKLVQDKIASGLYRDADEVVHDALRQMQERDAGLDWLRSQAGAGFEQLDQGEFVELTREELLAHLKQRRAA